jgi:hypothetical protein
MTSKYYRRHATDSKKISVFLIIIFEIFFSDFELDFEKKIE